MQIEFSNDEWTRIAQTLVDHVRHSRDPSLFRLAGKIFDSAGMTDKGELSVWAAVQMEQRAQLRTAA